MDAAMTTAATGATPATRATRRGPLARLRRQRWLMRIVRAVITVYVVITITFFLIRLLPGDPADVYESQLIQQYSIPAAQARDMASHLFAIDLNKPIVLQYVDYIGNLAHGNLGTSILASGTPVTTILGQFVPWTLFSVAIGLLISFVVGTLLGLVMAYWRESWLDHALTAFASVFSSVPNYSVSDKESESPGGIDAHRVSCLSETLSESLYLVGLFILIVVGVQLHWVDLGSMRGTNSVQPGFSLAFVGDVLYHGQLIIITYAVTLMGTWMLTMKSNVLNVLGEDYVTVAKARGLREGRVMRSYVGHNAVLPVVSQLATLIGVLVSSSVLVETVFAYPGVGWELINSINQRDYPVMQGGFLVITVIVVLANLLAETLYGRLDPRIGSRGR